ncbi:unnamed protein product [Urochloa humidicola]
MAGPSGSGGPGTSARRPELADQAARRRLTSGPPSRAFGLSVLVAGSSIPMMERCVLEDGGSGVSPRCLLLSFSHYG